MLSKSEKPVEFVRNNIKKTISGAAVFFVVMVVAGIYFEPQIEAFVQNLYERLGIFGLSLFIFLNDTLISPLPGDVAVIIVSKSSLREFWYLAVLWFGILSTLAGFCGYQIGYYFGNKTFFKKLLGKELPRLESLVQKHARLILILGALTPVPYSVTTWIAGTAKIPRSVLFFPLPLRIPRFFIVYLILLKSEFFANLFHMFKQ